MKNPKNVKVISISFKDINKALQMLNIEFVKLITTLI